MVALIRQILSDWQETKDRMPGGFSNADNLYKGLLDATIRSWVPVLMDRYNVPTWRAEEMIMYAIISNNLESIYRFWAY